MILSTVVMFDAAPNRLIRIQPRLVRRQEEQLELDVEALLHAFPVPAGMVHPMIIQNQAPTTLTDDAPQQHRLTEVEEAAIMAACNQPVYRSLPPF